MTDAAHPPGPEHDPARELAAHRRRYEARYRERAEPWSYSASGAEQLRFDRVLEIARRWRPRCRRALDVGCSLGQFTRRIAGYADTVLAIDLAHGAVNKARRLTTAADVSFLVCSATDLCFRGRTVDVVFYCDGLREHALGPDLEERMARDIRRLLADGGIALFTDYVHPRDFDDYVATVRRLGFTVLDVRYLYDRPWFRLKSWFGAVPQRGPVRRLLASRSIARGLSWIGRLRGRSGSRHLCVVAAPAGQDEATGPRQGTGR